MLRLLALCTTLALSACGGSSASSAPPAPTAATSFNLAVIPDTQFYSENNERGFLNLNPRYPKLPFEPIRGFQGITQWLADHADDYQVAFAVHVGDIVQSGTEKKNEWKRADAAMARLEAAGVPYSLAPGNHDVRDKNQQDSERTHNKELFLDYFGRNRTANGASLISKDPLGYSEARHFTALGQRFMVLALDWRTSDATLQWANEMVAQHPNTPVIVASHDILDVDLAQHQAVVTGNGERLWEKLIRHHDQIFMTISGHNHHAARTQRFNDQGLSVDMILVDYQDEYAGGNGLMRLLEMDLAAGTVTALTFSPWVLEKYRDSGLHNIVKDCPDLLTTADCDQLQPQPNVEQPGIHLDHQYRFALDFRQRFAPFRGFTASVGQVPFEPSLSDLLREELAAAAAAFNATR
ncbi:metallophosphoesterase [Isoalcanivorax beigongshangi]|uniref:Metallophosphoesterase n=1 Tax=Isoalcanivorax beigongshangi TaxID=3238810 RepID=A0ABV4AHS5_9GAMM